MSKNILFPSEDLQILRLVVSHLGVEFDVIADANRILKDIRYVVKKNDPGFTTTLLEVMESQALKVHAPEFLKDEVKKNIPLIAEKHKLDETEMFSQWERFQKYINFHEVDEVDMNRDVRDPKDYPYIQAQEIVNSPIISKDKDIPSMGGVILKEKALDTLRQYARDESKLLGIKLMGDVTLRFSASTLEGVIEFIGQFTKKNWAVILVIIGTAYVYRKEIESFLNKNYPWLVPILSEGIKYISEQASKYSELTTSHSQSQEDLETHFGELMNELSIINYDELRG